MRIVDQVFPTGQRRHYMIEERFIPPFVRDFVERGAQMLPDGSRLLIRPFGPLATVVAVMAQSEAEESPVWLFSLLNPIEKVASDAFNVGYRVRRWVYASR